MSGYSMEEVELYKQVHETLTDAIERHIKLYVSEVTQSNVKEGQLYTYVIGEVERALFKTVLSVTGGNQIRASAILGLHRNTLRKKIRDLI